MTKHKPATPLPWKYNKAVTIHAVSGARRVVCKETHEEAQYDLPYLTHAANAYPRLVEALRDADQLWALDESERELTGFDKSWNDKRRALLRELGEL